MIIYKIDKKTGKKYRIVVPDWDTPLPINNPVAPRGEGMNLTAISHAAFPILSNSGTTYTWVFSFNTPTNWLLQTSTNNGNTWTTNQTISGGTFTATATVSAGTQVSIIGIDANNNYITGRSNIIQK
jgi:hypothetical protein